MIGAVLLSILLGVVLTLFVQYVFVRYWLKSLPVVKEKWKSQSDPFVLPQELLKIFENLKDHNEKESYKGLNFVFQFLFQELKDADHVRKWAMKRLKNEFSEMMQSTTGKLLDGIRIRGFNLGRTFPVIKNVSLSEVNVDEDNVLVDVSLLLDLTYNGRFQLAVDVDMVFGKSAYLSVTVTKLQGTARLQFSTVPYRHWSFAFTEDPLLEFEVDSHFEGRPIARLTSIITNQIKRQVRKKHTLPNYKIRYKPFFVMPAQRVEPREVFYRNMRLSIGKLNVVVVGCTGLIQTPPDSFIYCSLAVDSLLWTELMNIKKKLWMPFECELVKSSPQFGLTFEEEFLLEKFEEVVVVTSVSPGSPAHKAGIQKNDVIVNINGVKVTSSKQAFRIIRLSAEKVSIKVDRDVSAGAEVAPNNVKKEIIKVPSMDSISLYSKDFEVKDGVASVGSEDSLLGTKPNISDGSTVVAEDSKLKTVASASNVSLESAPLGDKDSVKEAQKSEETYVENLLSWNPCTSDDLIIGEPTGGEALLKKTRLFKSCQNPVFNQRFCFNVKEHHNYLNICVWCREVEKLDKQLKVTKVEKDTLLGHVSISLMDVALECSTTLQGDFTNSFNLVPSQSKMGSGRQQYSAVSTHPGFEERLCHGDLLLRFHYSREEEDVEHNLEIFDNFHMENANASLASKPEKVSSNFHCFQPAQFQSAVYCKFCSKKIWFKSAFMCTTCKMVCHKKCIEKCQLQTTCTRSASKNADNGGGERKRHKSAPDDPKKDSLEVRDASPPLESNNLTRKSSSSSLKDLSGNELLTDNGDTSAESKNLKSGRFWNACDENADEKLVTAAKSVGRQLYTDLELDSRKERFDEVIQMTQLEIERENKNQSELRSMEGKTTEKKMKGVLKDKIKNSEDKLKSLKVLMLQYCAGLQHCLDEEESLRQKKASQQEDLDVRPDLLAASPRSGDQFVGNASTEPLRTMIAENVLKCDSEGKFDVDGLQGEDYFDEPPLTMSDLCMVSGLLKHDDDVKSELLEAQALLAFQHSSDTSSQKSFEMDTSPEGEGFPDSVGDLIDFEDRLNKKFEEVSSNTENISDLNGVLFKNGISDLNARASEEEEEPNETKKSQVTTKRQP